MINLILLFLLISTFSVFGSLYNKKYEEIMPITVVGIMLYLYVFYVFNILHIGFYLICFISILFYLFSLYKFIRKEKACKRDILKNIFTPGFVVYLLGFVGLYMITKNNKVLLWDELRLWGAYPKILFYNGNLQLGNTSQLLDSMRSYNPGMPLFLYFVTKSMGVFKEELLFFGYSLVGYSILIPITKNITWKHWIKIPFYVMGLIFFPLLFANSNNDCLVYYYTLFIEPAMGIIFGYSMFLTFENVLKDRYKYVLLMVMVCGMTMFKDTGILFSITVGLSFVFSEIFNYKSYKKIKYGIFKMILVLIIPLLFFGSWKFVQSLYKSENMYTSVLDKSEIVSLFSNPSVEQKQLLSDAKTAVFYTPIVKSNFSSLDKFYTFPTLTILFVSLFCLFILICGKKDFKNIFIPLICFGIGGFVYFFGTLFVYFFSIHAVASFPRYISLLFTAASVLLVFLLVSRYFKSNNKIKIKLNYFVCLLILVCFFVLPIRQPKILDVDSLTAVNSISEQYSTEITRHIDNSDKLALVFGYGGCDSNVFSQSVLYHHQIYLDMISNGYDYLDFYFIGDKEVYNNLLKLGYGNLRLLYVGEISNLKDYAYAYYINLNYLDSIDNSNYIILDMDDSDLFKLSESGEVELIK